MAKNTMVVFVLGLVALFLGGCVGMLPEKSWTEFKAEQKKVELPSSGVQVKKTYIPNDGVKGSVSYKGIGAGAEVYDESRHRGDTDVDKTVIKLFGGKEGPDYNKGRRDEKKDARWLKDEQEYRLAISLAEQHANDGYMSYIGVPGKYHEEYKRAYKHFASTNNRKEFNDYRRSEYERGVEDFRAKNPEYGNFAQLSEQLEAKARTDARASRYELPGGLSPELERVYYEVFVSEVKSLLREKARRDAKMEIFDPPYNMPDFVKYYEMVYEKETDRLHRKHDRRR